MNFSEQLDKFVERGANSYQTRVDEGDEIPYPSHAYKTCGAFLKPIVLKLYNDLSECKAILMRQWGTEEKIMSLKGPPLERIILEALAEVEQIIGGRKC